MNKAMPIAVYSSWTAVADALNGTDSCPGFPFLPTSCSR